VFWRYVVRDKRVSEVLCSGKLTQKRDASDTGSQCGLHTGLSVFHCNAILRLNPQFPQRFRINIRAWFWLRNHCVIPDKGEVAALQLIAERRKYRINIGLRCGSNECKLYVVLRRKADHVFDAGAKGNIAVCHHGVEYFRLTLVQVIGVHIYAAFARVVLDPVAST
jgi:hypothetical protein